jgi:hypothetical protein
MSTFDAVLAQYEKNKQAAGGNVSKVSQEDRLKKYFTTVLPKGVRNGQKRIRIVPMTDGTSPFVEKYFHEVQVDGNWMKLYDPKQEGLRSPLNEVREALYMTGLESDKILARQYTSRKFYIVKVIDRENEQDGVKFWRFKHNSKNEGVMDKIMALVMNKIDIFDVNSGRDLIITLGLTKAGNGREYTSITSIFPADPSPLHSDPTTSDSWINDELTWADVYSKKPEEYLEMVARGEVPKWDSENKKWTSNSQEEDTLMAPPSSPAPSVSVPQSQPVQQVVVDPQAEEEADDDLPF